MQAGAAGAWMAPLAVAALMVFHASPSQAVEGGTSTYLLGSRDSLAGIVPPPGTYVTTQFIHLQGDVSFAALGGKPLIDLETSTNIFELIGTQVFEGDVLGGRPAISFTLPAVSGEVSFTGTLGPLTGGFTDRNSAFGDLTVTPMLGWSEGNSHWLVAASFFLPTGQYELGSVSAATGVQVLNFGRNRFAVDPVVAYTYLDLQKGREYSIAGGVTFSSRNDATDYQSAPEAHIEATAMQYLPSKLGFGLTGYAYKQLDEDSGAGADRLRFTSGSDSLQAEVYSIGPVVSYATKIGATSVSMKVKYVHEFGAKRMFENNSFWAGMTFSF
ncbi:MAG: transporter [Rhodobacterales bacterium]|nr:transporter [Rhodobacterales bacterium]